MDFAERCLRQSALVASWTRLWTTLSTLCLAILGSIMRTVSNDSPTSAQNLLFLGAGASRPLGKMLMAEFIDYLMRIPFLERSALFHDIVEKRKDLEFLLEELQDIGEKGYLQYKLIDQTQGGLAGLGPQRDEIDFSAVAQRASSLRMEVEKQVFLHYRAIEDEDQIGRLLGPLFERLANASPAPLVVFTTNYDPAVERLCVLSHKYDCIDGFVHDLDTKAYIWDRHSYDSHEASFGKKPVFLFKLHGSVDWIRKGTRIERGTPLFSGTDALYKNVVIYPATKKVAIEDPFFTCYTYLQECLSKAKYCLFAGYSFRDYDVITRIRSATRHNPGLRIQILDPTAKSLAERLHRFEIDANPLAARLEPGLVLPEIKPHSER